MKSTLVLLLLLPAATSVTVMYINAGQCDAGDFPATNDLTFDECNATAIADPLSGRAWGAAFANPLQLDTVFPLGCQLICVDSGCLVGGYYFNEGAGSVTGVDVPTAGRGVCLGAPRPGTEPTVAPTSAPTLMPTASSANVQYYSQAPGLECDDIVGGTCLLVANAGLCS